MKRTLFTLSVTCLLTFAAECLRADTCVVDGVEWSYTVERRKAKIGNLLSRAIPSSTKGTLVIPSKLGGVSVTSIGDGAFLGCCGLTSVTIPSSVRSLSEYAFGGCVNLKSFSVDPANPNYSSVNGLLCSKDGRILIAGINGDVTIPSCVTSIGLHAFSGCSGLTSFSVDSANPNYSSVNGLLCSKDGKTLIAGINGDVTIPSCVTSIGRETFCGCASLKSFSVDPENPNYSSVNGLLCSKDGTTLIRGINGKVVIPSSVTSIETWAFANCRSLISVMIPSSVTSIGPYTFSRCRGLTSVTIPSSVTSIGNSAFSGCRGLMSVTIPASVTSVGEQAFDGTPFYANLPDGPIVLGGVLYGIKETCPASVTVPSGVTSIGNSAFKDCRGLTSLAIPSGVTNIGEAAFSGCCGLTSVAIPSSVEHIGDWAFYGCSGLTSIFVDSANPNYSSRNGMLCNKDGTALIQGVNGDGTIPFGVTSIGNAAFYSCCGLSSVTIPSSVTNIGNGAFSVCSGLSSVAIPSSVTNIGNGAFSVCRGLTSISVDPVNPNYSSRNGMLCNKDGTILIQGVNGDVAIPSCVTNIGRSAFAGCNGLTSVTIPSSVTHIGRSAFSGCRGLTSVTIPEGVTSIGWNAFCGCRGLTSVTIPSSVTSIGNSAFSGCRSVTSFSVDSANPNYSSVNGLLCSKDGRILIAGINGDVTIPSSVTRIGSFAFEGRESLTSVEIPLSVTNIGFGAFQECPLKKVLVAKGDEDRVKKLLKKSGGLDVSGLKFGEMSAP